MNRGIIAELLLENHLFHRETRKIEYSGVVNIENGLQMIGKKLADGEGTEAQQRRWEKTVDDLAAEKKRLEKAKEDRLKQVEELQRALTRASTQPGNDFVTRALGT